MTAVNPASRQKPAAASPRSSGDMDHPVLRVIPAKCVGCRTCEVACSFAHSRQGRPGFSRIRIHPAGPKRFVQMTCLQCVNAACVDACPTGALVRNDATRAVVLIESLCVGCGACAAACPFGHMHMDTDSRRPIKCDLCGGHPACAAFCPHGALEWR
ncbi:MAG: 4Fe-4S dicluster domain-containing protein [Deltaproteobacteria bacterium]|nr:MAG: 4Fe-4S dicluster domain-containing protein [Deltaproteobacteria bacterium]